MPWTEYLRFLFALIFVLALIGGLAWLIRRQGLGGMRPGHRGEGQRLSVVESRPLDARRRLAILRCDEREYLVLTGGDQDLLLDSGLSPASPAAENG